MKLKSRHKVLFSVCILLTSLFSFSFVFGLNINTVDQVFSAGEGVIINPEEAGNYTAYTNQSDYWGPYYYTLFADYPDWNTAFGWGDHGAAGYLTKATADGEYLNLSGTNANQDINVSPYTFTAGVGNFTSTGNALSVKGVGAAEPTFMVDTNLDRLYFRDDGYMNFGAGVLRFFPDTTMTVSTGMTFGGVLLPSLLNTHDIGTEELTWRDIYVDGFLANTPGQKITVAQLDDTRDRRVVTWTAPWLNYALLEASFNEVLLNTTIEGLLASTTYYANNSAVTGGTYTDTSNIEDAHYYDSASLNFTEGGGADPLDIVFNFTAVEDFSQIVIREYYKGSTSHHMQIQVWDYDSSTWENYFDFVGQSGYTVLNIPVYDSSEHLDPVDSNVTVRLHHVQNGVSSHRLYTDFIWLVDGNNIGSSTNLEGYAKYDFGYNSFDGNGNFTTAANVTADNFYGNFLGSSNFSYWTNESGEITTTSNVTIDITSGDAGLWIESEVNKYACIHLRESSTLGFSFCNDGSATNLMTFQNADGDVWMSINRNNGEVDIDQNLTIGSKLEFELGEMIDNLVNGWIAITGSLNVTEDVSMNGTFSNGVNASVWYNETHVNYDGGGLITCIGYCPQ